MPLVLNLSFTLSVTLVITSVSFACSSPSGATGVLQYFSAEKKMKWCDGNQWVDPSNASSTGCAPAQEGHTQYSSGDLRYCNGTNWVSMKGPESTACTAAESGNFNYKADEKKYRFCNGSKWYHMVGSACGGQLIAGFCWYISDPGKSCTETCSTHGGYNAATRTYVGDQGTDARCTTIGQALGLSSQVSGSGSCSGDRRATGCSFSKFLNVDFLARCKELPTTADAFYAPGVQRICACNN